MIDRTQYENLVSTSGLVDLPEPLVDVVDHALVDLDGVTYQGANPIVGAAAGLGALRANQVRVTFVTNNASRTPRDVADQLVSLGIDASEQDVLTSAIACARYLGDFVAAGSPVLVIGGAGIQQAVADAGYRVVHSADDRPAAVAQGFGPELGWSDLAEAAYAINQGAVHVASNLDLSLPTTRGLAPGNGSLVRAVQAATGVEPHSAGKPSPTMYRMAVDSAHSQAPLVIGDRLDTDLAGARGGGYLGLLVLTGVHRGRQAVLAPREHRPHLIVAHLDGVTRPHRAPTLGADGWWHAPVSDGEALARVTDGALAVRTAPGYAAADVDLRVRDEAVAATVRAACAAAWDWIDRGGSLDPDSVPNLGA